MRKVALLNSARRRAKNREEILEDGLSFQHPTVEHQVAHRTRSTTPSKTDSCSETPTPTFIPLGLSNYEALDLDGDAFVDDPWVELEDEVVCDDSDLHDAPVEDGTESPLAQSEEEFETVGKNTTTAKAITSLLVEENGVEEIYPVVFPHNKSHIENSPLYFLPYSTSVAL